MLKTIKKLSSFVGEYKINSILSPLLVLLEVVMECFIPAIAGELITFIQSPSKLDDLIFTKPIILAMQKSVGYDNIIPIIAVLCGILVILALLSLMFGAFAGIHCSRASCGFAKNLRRGLYEKSQDFSFENIDKFSTSSLVTRLTTDVTNVQQSFMMIIRTAIRSPFMFVFSIIMAFIVGGKMAWIFVVVIPILAFTLIMVSKKAMPIFRKVFKKYDKLNGSIQENVAGMRVVKSFVREDYENKKFNDASEDVRADFTRADKILAFNGPIMQLCMYFLMVGILLFGSNLLISSGGRAFDVGNFSTLLAYGMQILMSLMMVSMIFVMTTMSLESANRICEVIDEEATIKNPQNPVTEVKNGDIVFDNVSFKYSQKAEKFALSNINLSIKSGQTVGIIGGTGSSKSSLIQLIPRLYDVTNGKVLVGGVDVRNYDIVTLRDAVGIVLQKNVLFSGTIKENLRWGNENATDEELVRACKLSCADEFIQVFPEKYDTYIEQGGSNVSGGQKQRLCIARTLLKKPKILILDDSTSAVDTKTDAMIRKAMAEEIPDTTKIIIAQRISSVQDADIIVILDDGKINAIGNHASLLESSEIYKEIYTSQIKGAGSNE
ncbi:MAG: ABC transporter ATP-binding protein [Clostridia bacterium]|nr:ABC transporter ATP-binding protein [Clostridia bacterium]